ncbi:MAG: FAD:protein FMN transferase [Herminiimonas sp.]|nr:FAD:protein FMN transferase [Herminiimonas sp.]
MRRAQPWLGTLVEISVPEDDSADTRHVTIAINAAFAAIARVHHCMSFHAPDSDVSAVNRLEVGARIQVDASTAEVLHCALLLEEASDGIFNPACAGKLCAWGYLPTPESTVPGAPSAFAVTMLPRTVLRIDGTGEITKLLAGWIDLGGIAKGHAVDRAVAALQDHGIAAGCVNAGGDLRAFGDAAFPVVIRDPGAPTRAACTLALQNHALATSACYFSWRDIDGVPHSALVDGADGSTLVSGRSVSVLAPSCMLADGLTKIVMATGDAQHPLLARFGATAFII